MPRVEVDIALDRYGDLFSDFDIRDYRERVVSLDFLRELERRVSSLDGCPSLTLLFTLPRKARDRKVERVVKARLREIFLSRAERYKGRMASLLRKGALFVAVGVAFLALSVFIASSSGDFLSTLLAEFLFLPSWFFTWSGLEAFVEAFTRVKRKRDLFLCLSKAAISFRDEESYPSPEP